MFSLLCSIISSAVGTLIPLFYSYKTIKKPTHKSSVYWLKYWCVYGVGYTVDALLNSFFLTWFIPFYDVMKLGLVVWCVNPYTAGAQFTFDKVLVPFIRKHERRMEKTIDMMVSKIADLGPYLITEAGRSLRFNYSPETLPNDDNETVGVVTEFASLEVVTSSSSQRQSSEVEILILRDVKQEPVDDSYDQIEIIGHSHHSPMDVSENLSMYSSGDEEMPSPENEIDKPVRKLTVNANADISMDRIKDEPIEEGAVRRSSRLRSRAQGVAAIRRWSRSTKRALQPIKSEESV